MKWLHVGKVGGSYVEVNSWNLLQWQGRPPLIWPSGSVLRPERRERERTGREGIESCTDNLNARHKVVRH